MNYYPDRDGRIAELDTGSLTSSSLVQQRLAESHVVKAFNNIAFIHLLTLARPTGAPDRSALPIAGDHPTAKADVTDLLDTLGYDAVDVGALADSWRFEPGTPVYTEPYFPGQPPEGLTREAAYQWFLETPGVAVPTALVETLTTNTTRPTPGGKFPNPK
jgi:predicted dinucleotide-binding enzyme